MPLIILTGIPCSGKSTRAQQLKTYFEEQGKDVIIVSEEEQYRKANFDKNAFFKDSHKEKQIRGVLKSEVMKLIGPKNLVIFDAGNYIKGYRYELYCASKNNRCTQCTVHCLIPETDIYSLNETRPDDDKYTKEILDALCMRYEYPDDRNRWDSPLFTVQLKDELNFQEISEHLFKTKTPKPNKSTQNAPLSDTNFLYELDRITNEISKAVIIAKNTYKTGDFCLPDYPDLSINLSNVTIGKLNQLRRQYITYSKMHTPELKNIGVLYIQFLKTNFVDSQTLE